MSREKECFPLKNFTTKNKAQKMIDTSLSELQTLANANAGEAKGGSKDLFGSKAHWAKLKKSLSSVSRLTLTKPKEGYEGLDAIDEDGDDAGDEEEDDEDDGEDGGEEYEEDEDDDEEEEKPTKKSKKE